MRYDREAVISLYKYYTQSGAMGAQINLVYKRPQSGLL
jgi:hypothetical protein